MGRSVDISDQKSVMCKCAVCKLFRNATRAEDLVVAASTNRRLPEPGALLCLHILEAAYGAPGDGEVTASTWNLLLPCGHSLIKLPP